MALIGHYLRITENPKVDMQRGALVGGGSWEMIESAATAANLYDWGVVSAMPYLEIFSTIATSAGDMDTVSALKSIHTRLARAARALDKMLAALSNPVTGKDGPTSSKPPPRRSTGSCYISPPRSTSTGGVSYCSSTRPLILQNSVCPLMLAAISPITSTRSTTPQC